MTDIERMIEQAKRGAEAKARNKDAKPVGRKPGPVWCKMGKRRITRNQLAGHSTYPGAPIQCEECGTDTFMSYGDPFVMDYAFYTHKRADQYVDDRGNLVRVPRETVEAERKERNDAKAPF